MFYRIWTRQKYSKYLVKIIGERIRRLRCSIGSGPFMEVIAVRSLRNRTEDPTKAVGHKIRRRRQRLYRIRALRNLAEDLIRQMWRLYRIRTLRNHTEYGIVEKSTRDPTIIGSGVYIKMSALLIGLG